MANRLSIAVIIPTYNSGKLFEETLNSVLGQTLAPDEVLVNDDASSDGTPELAERFGSPVRVFRRANQGQAASRNFAATQTTCEWLAFLDHDDLWVPHKLQRQIEELARTPSADLCYSARVTFQKENGTLRRTAVHSVPAPKYIRKSLFRNTTFLPGSVLIRRSTFLAAGGFNPALKLVEDWDLWLRLLHSNIDFAACLEPLLLVRRHANNQSNNAVAALAEQKEIYRRLVLPYLPAHSRWLAHQSSQSGQEAFASMVLRENGDPRHLRMMARSLLRFPFGRRHRYKVFAHMLCSRLGLGNAMSPARSPNDLP